MVTASRVHAHVGLACACSCRSRVCMLCTLNLVFSWQAQHKKHLQRGPGKACARSCLSRVCMLCTLERSGEVWRMLMFVSRVHA